MGHNAAVSDHRRAAAERNIEAILDAADRLLAADGSASTSAVAAASGLSRVTVYAHFPTRADLLKAVAERVISRCAQALGAAGLTDGPAAQGLDRLIDTSWAELAASRSLLAAARHELPNEALVSVHKKIDGPILRLIKRGQKEGEFRSDVSARWLLATYYALMHACGDEVNAGRLSNDHARVALTTTIHRVFSA